MFEPRDLESTIRSDRLDLIPLVRSHADGLFAVLANDALYEYTCETPPASLPALRDRFARLEARRSPDGTQAWLNWLLLVSGQAVGYVQATVTAAEADVAWVVGVPWQGRGYASEAARAMISWLRSAGVRVVRANIHPEHSASQRVARKAGLSRTAETVDGEEVWALGAEQSEG
jgi:RimJ/RimL family protein N-acetyltransferase